MTERELLVLTYNSPIQEKDYCELWLEWLVTYEKSIPSP